MLKFSLGAAAVASSLTLAKAQNSASCSVSVFASTVSASEDAFVEFGKELKASICDGDESISVSETESAVARAIAEAVAVSSVDCEITGQGGVAVDASAKAATNATASAAAIGRGFASVDNCKGCTAAVDLFASSSETVFLEAIAESEVLIKEFNDARGRTKRVKRDDVVKDIQEKVLDTFVTVVLDVSAAADSCSAGGAVCVETGANFACCDLEVSNEAIQISTDAIADAAASADAHALTCGEDDDGVDDFSIAIAEATALAYAEALTEAHGYCKSEGADSSACGLLDGSITALASAQAKAWAESFASASNECGCIIEAEALAVAVEVIFAQATTSLIADICAIGDDTFADIDLVFNSIDSQQVDAIAIAVAQASADGEGCRTFNDASATSGESAASCTISVDNAADSFAEDVFAGIDADVGVYLCTDGAAEAELDIVAKAFGTLWASVITEVNAFCFSTGEASACSLVDSQIRAVAKAAVTSMVHVLAGTLSDPDKGCGCTVDVELTVETMVDVIVSVTLDVFGGICVEGEAFENTSLFLQAFETTNFEAIAGLWVRVKKEIIDGDSTCSVDLTTTTSVDSETVAGENCAECAARNQNCHHPSFEDSEGNPLTKGCCDVEQHCVRKNRRVAKCRDVDGNIPDSWNGEVLTCTQTP